jgi:23S rRNA U2552 (ribose-2'-O)-methylase RlmE/FtsJ
VFLAGPVTSKTAWEHGFTAQETVLHTLRKRINDYERERGQSEWEYYKKIVNPYELVYTQRKYPDFPDSVCFMHPLSRSYFKMVEILHITRFFDELGSGAQRLRSAHVCEGPGGFIESFLDGASRRRLEPQKVTAMTLRPNQPNVPGWKRAATFLHKHRVIKIAYGADGTGDLLSVANQEAFIRECGPKVQLFTGDGGFDFSLDYDAQERTMFPLLVASARVGLEVLGEGGVFVLKFFDFYHDGTRDLLTFLSDQFRTWTLYKPATSRPCNPEYYFVGKGLKRVSAAAMALVRSWAQAMDRPSPPATEVLLSPFLGKSVRTEAATEVAPSSPLPLPLPPPILHRLLAPSSPSSPLLDILNEAAVSSQIAYLERVFHLIDSNQLQSVKGAMLAHHEQVSYTWCRQFNVPVYPERCRTLETTRTLPVTSDFMEVGSKVKGAE